MNIPVKDGSVMKTLNQFFRSLLKENIVDALLLPQAMFQGATFSHTLVTDHDKITHAQPFVPVLMNNGGVAVGELTAGENGKKIGAVLRSCEIRAAVELAKFNQANLDNLIIIGVDCLGTLESKDFAMDLEKKDFSGEAYIKGLLNGQENRIRPACRVCPYPYPEKADIILGFIGVDASKNIFIDCDDKIAEKLQLKKNKPPEARKQQIEKISKEKNKLREKLIKDMKKRFASVSDLLNQFARCKRCYNCRTECPICFCNECIFLTNVFEHESQEYLRWADRKGALRIPYDTLLFHLTRLNHMAFSCVGCGQCSSACPNDLPVFELFQYVGDEVQKIFDYIPGMNIEEEPPISTFREKELEPM